ncbi:MAG: hypothetical protein KJ659_06110 [Actinobacteria bacterium]|nr:hypothetical protein [Actinomycetota bacterium]MBU1609343.1 hypothetical protein [Actinomycetota bacterium]MBU2314975.1 hypothetical protein [Actinomycetota bacterium]MBU2385059.1 hypothetical protein [Actinomycetota bacterium]
MEFVAVIIWMSTGYVVARALGASPRLGLTIAWPVGVAIYVTAGLLLVATYLPTWPYLALALGAFLGLAVLTATRSWRAFTFTDLRLLIAASAFAVLAQATLTQVHLVTWHTDSFFNIESSMLLADNNYAWVSGGGAAKRQIAIPLVHAMSIQAGGGAYVESFAPLVSLSVVALVWTLLRAALSSRGTTIALAAAASGVLLLLTNNRFVFHAFYVNGHLFFASMLLIAVGLLWAHEARFNVGCSGWTAISVAAVVFPALVVTRPEGALVLAMVVIVVWTLRLRARHKTLLTVVAGASTALWHAHLTLIPLVDGGRPPVSSYGLLILGAAVSIAPVVLTRLPPTVMPRALVVVEVGLWIALGLFALVDYEVLLRSGYATIVNLLLGEGGWGLSLVALGLVGLLLLWFTRGSDDLVIRFVITSFVPIALLLAYLRDGAYRIGDGDSLNRMWMQLLPLMIIFVVSRALTGSRGETRSMGRATNGSIDAPEADNLRERAR